MAFELFAPLFDKVDSITSTFVSDISSRAIAEITPVVTTGMSLALVLYGILIMRGAVDMPVHEFIGRAIRIGIITSVALAGGLYQSDIAEAITTTPDALAQALISDATTGDTAASLVDEAAGEGFDRASEAFEKAGFLSSEGWTYSLFGVIILLATAILTAIGGALLLLAKVALSLLAGLGPFFILALLFQPTHRFFELWAGQVVNYALVIVLFAAVFGFMMDIFGNYMEDLRFDGAQNAAYALGGATILAAASILILLQLPSMASGLASGVGLGYLWELRTLRGGLGSAGRGTGRAGRMLYSRGEKQSDGSRGNAGGRIPAAYRGGKAVAGYFKGRKAA